MAVQIQIRRDTTANWNSVDPILAQGEMGLELDTGYVKLGDGVLHWSVLLYWDGPTSGMTQGEVLRRVSLRL